MPTLSEIQNPYPPILNLAGAGLNAGKVYIGVAGQDPISFPQAVFWDAAGTVPAPQPLDVFGGYVMRLGSPAQIFTASTYSMLVRDLSGLQVFYAPNLANFTFALSDLSNVGPLVGRAALGEVANIPALRSVSWPNGRPTTAQVSSNWTAGDGGGVFRWDSASVIADNGGTIIKESTVTTGRWVRQWVGPVFLSWFGSGSSAFSAAMSVSIPLGVAIDGQNASVTFGTTGIRQSILNGQRVLLQNLRLDITAVTAVMNLTSGWSSKIGLGFVAESSAGVDMWSASYPRTTLTAAVSRGAVALPVAELSTFSVGDEVLIHDTTRVWDADGTICSEGATVIAKSSTSGAGTLTLGGSLRSSYTTSATVRRWVAVDIEFDNVEVLGAGAGGDQDGIWVWGARSTQIRDCLATATENRGFIVCNGRMCDVESLRANRVARDGLGYALVVSGTDRVTVSGMNVSNGRHAFASGRGAGGSQMQSFITITNVVGDGMQDCLINAHPGVYSMMVNNIQTRGAINTGTSGDALILFHGTHLSASNARSTLARRHGVTIESFGHLDEARGHTYKFSNVATEAGLVANTQYGFVFSDAPCIAANGFTGAASSPVDVIEFSACDFVSRTGCLISNGVSLIREVRLLGGAYRSVGPAQHGHGFQTVVTGTGQILRVSGGMSVFESNGGTGFAAVYLAGRSGALLSGHLTGAACRGVNQWGVRMDQGTLVHAPIDATGFTTSATVAGAGGVLTPY